MSRSSNGLSARSVLLTLALLCTIFLATGFAAAADGSASNAGATGNELKQAPINPDFVQQTQQKAAGLDMLSAQVTADGHKLGLIPSPITRPEVRDVPVAASGAGTSLSSYAASYDLRTVSKVSPVKDQTYFGTCWAFATYGSLDSTLKTATVTAFNDFSEKNLANFAGFAIDPANGGGNMYMSAATLTRWNGPVSESSDPYPIGSTWTTSPAFSSAKHVQNVIFFPSHTTTGLASTNDIKSALTTYGAVYSSFYYHSSYYKAATSSYYQPYSTAADPSGGGGHAVTIVGWNDNYARTNFNTAPSGNGAWLVKNSWGTGWGTSGYFWVSYYDKYFGSRYHADAEAGRSTMDTAVFRGESASNYKYIYSYDKLGDIIDYSYGTTKTGVFANVYTTVAAGNVSAVGLYTTDVNATINIKIYKSPTTSPATGTLAVSYSKKLPSMGYNTVVIPLSSQPKLTKGQKFSVVITATNPTYNWYIPVEMNVDGYSSGVTSLAGQGYAKSGTTWTDWSTLVPDSNICVKAYMN